MPLPWGRPGGTPFVLLGHLPADAWSLRPPPLGGNSSSCPFPRNLKDSVKGRQGVPLARDKSQAAPRRPRRTRTRCILALKDIREEDNPPEVDVLRNCGKEARRSTAPTGQRWPGRHVARNHGRPQARSHPRHTRHELAVGVVVGHQDNARGQECGTTRWPGRGPNWASGLSSSLVRPYNQRLGLPSPIRRC